MCFPTWASRETCEAGGWGSSLLTVVKEAEAEGDSSQAHPLPCTPPPPLPPMPPTSPAGSLEQCLELGTGARLVSVRISSNVGGRGPVTPDPVSGHLCMRRPDARWRAGALCPEALTWCSPQLSPHLTGGHSRAQTGWVACAKWRSQEMAPWGLRAGSPDPDVHAHLLCRAPKDDLMSLTTGIRRTSALPTTLSTTLTVDKKSRKRANTDLASGAELSVVLGCRLLTDECR